MNWWETERWYAYEKATGAIPGTRAALLFDAPWQTRIVDLQRPNTELWADVRRSYHSLINGLSAVYPEDSLIIGERKMIGGREIMDEQLACRAMHEHHAGRQTRPDSTWCMQSDWVRDGYGMLTIATITDAVTKNSLLKGFAYFVVNDGWSYYFSGVSDQKNLGLAMIWWSILALRNHGVRWLETGWQGQAETDKERGIEFVRRGFSGRDVPARLSGKRLREADWDAAERDATSDGS